MPAVITLLFILTKGTMNIAIYVIVLKNKDVKPIGFEYFFGIFIIFYTSERQVSNLTHIIKMKNYHVMVA